MKKFRILFASLAVIAALVISAFTIIPANQKTDAATSLYWFDPSGSSFEGYRLKGNISTPGTQVYVSGCDGSAMQDECQRGYTVDKLYDPGDPELGVDPSKVDQYTDQIFIHQE